MIFFDLHCHPTFKYGLLSADEQNEVTIDNPIHIKFKGFLPKLLRDLIMWLFGDPLDSQSSVQQLLEGHTNLISHTIYALENSYAKSSIIGKISEKSNSLDKAKIAKIEQNLISYWELTQQQLDEIISIADLPLAHGRKIKIIKHFNEYNALDINTLHIIFNLEGGHCFYADKKLDNGEFTQRQTIRNLIAVKNSSIRPLYITLVHHARNDLANHAFAVPTTWAGNGTNQQPNMGGFNPSGAGMSTAGEEFIRTALTNTNGHTIYIDIKHMSVGTRQQYYTLRHNEFPTIPIIASHMGVTGLSWNDFSYKGKPIIRWVKNFEADPQVVEVKYNDIISYRIESPMREDSIVTFNPWSINLFDEDIEEIVRSGGIIGVALDIRILGMGNSAQISHEHEPERVSKAELLLSIQNHLQHGQNEDDFLPDPDIRASLNHVEYLCNNILHIVKVGRPIVGENIWDYMCLGSDFDGLIVSVEYQNNFRTKATNLTQLRASMKTTLPKVANLTGIAINTADDNLENILDKFFFKNAHNFLQKYFRN